MGSCGSKSEPRGVPIPRLWSPDSGEPLPPATELRRIATAKADPAVPALERSPTVDIEHRGVALGWIVAFTEAFGLARQPTWWVVEHVIKPLTAAAADADVGPRSPRRAPCRFVDLPELGGVVGRADTFVSHAWGGLWGDVVVGVGQSVGREQFVWLDVFAILQHARADDAHARDLDSLHLAIERTKCVTVVWNPSRAHAPGEDAPSRGPTARCWCLYEWHVARRARRPLVFAVGRADGARWAPYLGERAPRFRSYREAATSEESKRVSEIIRAIDSGLGCAGHVAVLRPCRSSPRRRASGWGARRHGRPESTRAYPAAESCLLARRLASGKGGRRPDGAGK